MRLPPTNHDGQVYAGTCGGTFLSIFSNMFVEDLVRTVILAVVGAVVSFSVSLVLKRLIKNPRPRSTELTSKPKRGIIAGLIIDYLFIHIKMKNIFFRTQIAQITRTSTNFLIIYFVLICDICAVFVQFFFAQTLTKPTPIPPSGD